MTVFLLAQVPLPVMLLLNWQVGRRYAQVRRQARGREYAKPRRLIWGWRLNAAATFIALVPSIVEWRIFVLDHRWLYVYGFTATLTIIGLLLMNSGLGHVLGRFAPARKR